jgi:hypothetical protein
MPFKDCCCTPFGGCCCAWAADPQIASKIPTKTEKIERTSSLPRKFETAQIGFSTVRNSFPLFWTHCNQNAQQEMQFGVKCDRRLRQPDLERGLIESRFALFRNIL